MLKKVLVVVAGVIIGLWLIDDFDPETVKGKRVLITGASTGIGEQLAYQYARHGAHIVITARREQQLNEVLKKCRELGGEGQIYGYVVGDMMDLDSTESLIQTAAEKLGGLDVLLLNHIILFPFGEWTGSKQNISDIRKVMTVNFESYVHLASYALPYLETSNGSIVVVSSVAGKIAQQYVALYSASKFALDGFFSALRQEFRIRNSGVSITTCVLGLIGTENAITLIGDFSFKFLLKTLKPASPSDTALAILRGAALRVRQVYFPSTAYPIVILRDWFPESVDWLNRLVTTRETV